MKLSCLDEAGQSVGELICEFDGIMLEAEQKSNDVFLEAIDILKLKIEITFIGFEFDSAGNNALEKRVNDHENIGKNDFF